MEPRQCYKIRTKRQAKKAYIPDKLRNMADEIEEDITCGTVAEMPWYGIWSIYIQHNIIIILAYGDGSLWVWSDGPQRASRESWRARTWAKLLMGTEEATSPTVRENLAVTRPIVCGTNQGCPSTNLALGFFLLFWALDLVINNLDFLKANNNFDLHVLRRQYCLNMVCPSKKFLLEGPNMAKYFFF